MTSALRKFNQAARKAVVPKKAKKKKEVPTVAVRADSTTIYTKVPGVIRIANDSQVKHIFADYAKRLVVLNCPLLEDIHSDTAGLVVVHGCPSLRRIETPSAGRIYTTCQDVDFDIPDDCLVVMDPKEMGEDP